MRIVQELWSEPRRPSNAAASADGTQLVLAFASPEWVRTPSTWRELRARWPQAALVVGSTAGEICGTQVSDDTLTLSAIEFENAHIRCARADLEGGTSSLEIGHRLAEQLLGEELRHVFVLSDGLRINGSELVRGFGERLPDGVTLSGGLCGDGSRFGRTYVCLNEFHDTQSVVAIGFYGSALRVGLGSLGGWDPFGPERRVTRSEGNVLFELDGQPALALYEQYLGEHAAGLPASGLLFPLTVRAQREDEGVVRTILSVDRATASLTFAGDVPQGHYARLMRANFDRLVDGAAGAARVSRGATDASGAELALLISCVGRKLVLKQRIEEEVEGVRQVLGPRPVLTGFYSYGEISPFRPTARCELHNQTMTITTLSES
jgi:hypothetical protein